MTCEWRTRGRGEGKEGREGEIWREGRCYSGKWRERKIRGGGGSGGEKYWTAEKGRGGGGRGGEGSEAVSKSVK